MKSLNEQKKVPTIGLTSTGSNLNIFTALPDEPNIKVFVEHYRIRSINFNDFPNFSELVKSH